MPSGENQAPSMPEPSEIVGLIRTGVPSGSSSTKNNCLVFESEADASNSSPYPSGESHIWPTSGRSLTAALLCNTYRGLVERYYGDAYTIGPDDDIEWAYIPHFYWKFYVYNYATGLSTGISLARAVSEGGEEARNRYLELLGAGSSLPPVELLARAGADLTKPDVIRDAARLLDETLDEMEALMK